LNDLSSSSTYLSKADAAGRKIDRGDYYDIGLRYKNLGTADEKAIDAFKNSLGIQQAKRMHGYSSQRYTQKWEERMKRLNVI
jgi:hypothetical protein